MIEVIQVDGKMPNLALMNISSFFKTKGEEVRLSRGVNQPSLFEKEPEKVFASAIFKYSAPMQERVKQRFPNVVFGGTGTGMNNTVEEAIGESHPGYDYSIYPEFQNSIGFTQRGCRLKCGFCVVPKKEGSNRSVKSISEIWRGEPYPKNLVLLDNDFFGQPKEQWLERIKEIKDGGFKVCFNQGLNVRLIDEEACRYLASIDYRDDSFKVKRVYTAWDNLNDEAVFFRGVENLKKAGIPPTHLMVYMLIGYDPLETEERIFYRFNKMVELGIKPYPMVFQKDRKDLKRFQRWVIRRYHEFIPWKDYLKNVEKVEEGQESLNV